jgi:hypothetical protein
MQQSLLRLALRILTGFMQQTKNHITKGEYKGPYSNQTDAIKRWTLVVAMEA